ncbi:MAG: hypothetical protein H7123_06615 [Thermoleophilia bacterium]|nr:hypothetical protein [Thermoleophilia bacterium]
MRKRDLHVLLDDDGVIGLGDDGAIPDCAHLAVSSGGSQTITVTVAVPPVGLGLEATLIRRAA